MNLNNVMKIIEDEKCSHPHSKESQTNHVHVAYTKALWTFHGKKVHAYDQSLSKRKKFIQPGLSYINPNFLWECLRLRMIRGSTKNTFTLVHLSWPEIISRGWTYFQADSKQLNCLANAANLKLTCIFIWSIRQEGVWCHTIQFVIRQEHISAL